MQRRTWLATVLTADARRQRAIRWLWQQQGRDGGWHSETYGLLRSGQSLTPFVLATLLGEALPSQGVARALAFLRAKTVDGRLGVADAHSADYPNYATAFAVRALARVGDNVPPAMRQYLLEQQFTQQNGWQPDDPAFGAWGMGGERRRPPGTGHVDLSMTRHVLEALRVAGVPAGAEPFTQALVYLERLQNPDGGFFFSTTEAETNKAGVTGEGRFRSYGTATADGLLALLAAGLPASHPRVTRAWTWLCAHHRPGYVAGFAPEERQWHHGLRFYYAAALGEAARALGQPTPDMALPAPELSGCWRNPESLGKEDDPLIATALALRATAV